MFLVKQPWNFFLEIFRPALSNCGTQKSLLRDENPGREHVTVFELWPRPKHSAIIIAVSLETFEMLFSMLCARTIDSRRQIPRLQKSAMLA